MTVITVTVISFTPVIIDSVTVTFVSIPFQVLSLNVRIDRLTSRGYAFSPETDNFFDMKQKIILFFSNSR